MPPTIAFLSDYGLADEFVGVCHAVMLGVAPDARIIDITHEIPAHDVRAGALALVRAVQYLPDGCIVVAVVDPGVGTARRLLAVEVDTGVLLGPDNGLLAPAVARLTGGARRVVSIENPDQRLPAPGPTFAGRDVLAPAAGHLATGAPIGDLGPDVDPATLIPGVLPLPQTLPGGVIAGEVWWVDRFGNCQLNIDPDELLVAGSALGDRVEVRVGGQAGVARWVAVYADAQPSELVLLVDSYGMLALCLDRASATRTLSAEAGTPVVLVPPGASESVGVIVTQPS